MKMLSILLLGFAAFLVSTTTVVAQTTVAAEKTAAVATVATQKMEVKVKGVGCSMDLKTLSEKVEALEGVAKVTMLKRGAVTTFEVEHNPTVATAEKIHATIEGTPGCTSPDSRPYKVKL